MKSLFSQIPTFTRFGRWIFQPLVRRVNFSRVRKAFRRVIKAGAFVVACMLTLSILFYTVEHWRWRRAWNAYAAKAKQEGKRLNKADYAKPPIPDSENFAAIPVFRDAYLKPNQSDEYDQSDRFDQAIFYALLSTDMTSLRSKGVSPTEGLAQQLRYLGTQNTAGNGKIVADINQRLEKDTPAKVALALLDEQLGPLIRELEEGSERPLCHLPLLTEKETVSLVLTIRKAGNLMSRRCHLHVLNGDGPAALSDLRVLARISDICMEQPGLTSAVFRGVIGWVMSSAVWSGLAAEVWEDQNLREVEALLENQDLIAAYYFGWESDKAVVNEESQQLKAGDFSRQIQINEANQAKFNKEKLWTERLPFNPWRFYPIGWVYRNQLHWNQQADALLESINLSQGTIDISPSRITTLKALQPPRGWLPDPLQETKENQFPTIYLRSIYRTTLAESMIRQARTAIALERYRKVHGSYPHTLDELIKESLLTKLPRDPLNNAPMEYQRTAENHYSLQSVETNRTTRDVVPADWPHAWEPRPAATPPPAQ